MSYWLFKHFHNDQRIDLIEAWLSGLPIEDRVKIERRFVYLATVKEKSDWKPPDAKKLRGTKKGIELYEIRINADRVLYRPLGCFGPKEGEFTVLKDAIEVSTGVFKPRKAIETATKRFKLIHQDRRYIGEYD